MAASSSGGREPSGAFPAGGEAAPSAGAAP